MTSHFPQVFYFILQSFNLKKIKIQVKKKYDGSQSYSSILKPNLLSPNASPSPHPLTPTTNKHFQIIHLSKRKLQQEKTLLVNLPALITESGTWHGAGEWEGTQPQGRQPLLVPLWLFLLCSEAHLQGEKGYSKENEALKLQSVMNLRREWGRTALKSPLQSFWKEKQQLAWHGILHMSGHMGCGLAVNCAIHTDYFLLPVFFSTWNSCFHSV